MKKLSTWMVVLMMTLTLTLVMAPGLALADSHDPDHGPRPAAVLGSVFGGAFWLVSTPFCLLLAPTHIFDSFEALVVDPWRAAIGAD